LFVDGSESGGIADFRLPIAHLRNISASTADAESQIGN